MRVNPRFQLIYKCAESCHVIPTAAVKQSAKFSAIGEITSNDISPESTKQIHSPKSMHTSMVGLYQSCIKIGEISMFEFIYILGWVGGVGE